MASLSCLEVGAMSTQNILPREKLKHLASPTWKDKQNLSRVNSRNISMNYYFIVMPNVPVTWPQQLLSYLMHFLKLWSFEIKQPFLQLFRSNLVCVKVKRHILGEHFVIAHIVYFLSGITKDHFVKKTTQYQLMMPAEKPEKKYQMWRTKTWCLKTQITTRKQFVPCRLF